MEAQRGRTKGGRRGICAPKTQKKFPVKSQGRAWANKQRLLSITWTGLMEIIPKNKQEKWKADLSVTCGMSYSHPCKQHTEVPRSCFILMANSAFIFAFWAGPQFLAFCDLCLHFNPGKKKLISLGKETKTPNPGKLIKPKRIPGQVSAGVYTFLLQRWCGGRLWGETWGSPGSLTPLHQWITHKKPLLVRKINPQTPEICAKRGRGVL